MFSSVTNTGPVVLRGIHPDPHQKTQEDICHQKVLSCLLSHVNSIVHFFDAEAETNKGDK